MPIRTFLENGYRTSRLPKICVPNATTYPHDKLGYSILHVNHMFLLPSSCSIRAAEYPVPLFRNLRVQSHGMFLTVAQTPLGD